MKVLFPFKVAALVAATVSTLSTFYPAIATTLFQQKEVEQNRFILLAAPRGQDAHQFLILEQVADSRPCWTESGMGPTEVDPLLLTFDFTGICGRSTDSNGYSMRHLGQDLGLQYQLRIVRRENDLVLIGMPTRDRNAPVVEIGRTNGIAPGFLKINLDPEWRLTKRSFDGKTLGHVYLTTEVASLGTSSSGSPTAPAPFPRPITPSMVQPNPQPVPAPIPVPPPASTRPVLPPAPVPAPISVPVPAPAPAPAPAPSAVPLPVLQPGSIVVPILEDDGFSSPAPTRPAPNSVVVPTVP